MLLYQPFPPDIRVEKEARSLLKDGHNIYLIASSDSGSENIELINGINVIRVKKDITHSLKWKYSSLKRNILFHDKKLVRFLEPILKKYSIDIIHVHDLPLVYTAILAAKNTKLPVIADLHENWPAASQIYLWKRSLINWIRLKTIDNVNRWRKHEKWVLSQVDHILVVVPEAAERLIEYGLDENKIHIISNTEEVDYFTGISIDSNIEEQFEDDFVISYIGGINHHRGVDCAIRAMPEVIKEIPNAKLLIVGAGDNYESKIKAIVFKLGIGQNVIFTGWQPFEKVSSYTSVSNICLVPHVDCEHTDTTIPHKLFQYMLMKKPVIVSNCRPLKRIVEEAKSGLVFDAGNEKGLASKIIYLYNNPEVGKQFGINGQVAVKEKYNWALTGERLCEIYRSLERVINSRL